MKDVSLARTEYHKSNEFIQGGLKFAETFELWGGLKAGERVLDIGCGAGRMAYSIGDRFNWSNPLIGFDVIEIDVEDCSRSISLDHPEMKFTHVNAHNVHYNAKGTIAPHEVIFPVETGSIDFAFATSIFTHMLRRETLHYLKEAKRCLAPGGRLLSTWFILTDDAMRNAEAGKARFNFRHRQQDGTYIENENKPLDAVAFRYDDAVALFREAGFQTVVFHQGAWSRTASGKPRHSQDAFVCS